MRRADRLFQIVQLIRGRRLSTAAFLADGWKSRNAPSTATWPTCSTRACPSKAKRGVGYRLGRVRAARSCSARVRRMPWWPLPARRNLAGPGPGARGGRRPGQDPVGAPRSRAGSRSPGAVRPLVGLDARTQATCRRCARRCKAAVVKLTTPMYKAAPACAQTAAAGLLYWGGVDPVRLVRAQRLPGFSHRPHCVAFQVLPERFRQEPGKTLADPAAPGGSGEGRVALECVPAPGQMDDLRGWSGGGGPKTARP